LQLEPPEGLKEYIEARLRGQTAPPPAMMSEEGNDAKGDQNKSADQPQSNVRRQ